MLRNLALALYVTLRPGRRVAVPTDLWAARPDGPLIWLHAAHAADLEALLHLAPRLQHLDPAPNILLTTSGDIACPGDLPENVLLEKLPPHGRAPATAFAQHMHPDAAVICGAPLPHALVWVLNRQGVPMTLVNIHATDLDPPGLRLIRPAFQALTRCFDQIITRDAQGARRLNRLRLQMPACLPLGRLEEAGSAPGADPDRLEQLRTALGGRPLWFAAETQPGEDPMVIEAHRQMARYSHRLLCAIAPAQTDTADALADTLARQGWTVARRSTDDPITSDVQIVIVDHPCERGLWFRLAPISFMGSSLIAGYGGQDPFAPATLGSAVLYGPNVGNYLDSYTRLINAGGARIVKDASSLAQGLQLLLAPDQAAAQAHAAWEVTSRGAAVTDKVLELLQAQLDERPPS